MSRKRTKSTFSFTKFFDAAVPNLFADVSTTRTAALLPLRRDMLYSHQLGTQNFYALDERSFFVAGIVEAERTSKSAHKALRKHAILNAEGRVDTMQIGPKFLHQLSFLDTRRQRELVNLLFWWHEECQRFTKLIEEERELTAMIAEAERLAAEAPDDIPRREMVDEVKFARERVRMKIRQRPTQRRPNTEANTDDIMERFRGRSQSAPLLPLADTTVSAPDEPLPSYNMVKSK